MADSKLPPEDTGPFLAAIVRAEAGALVSCDTTAPLNAEGVTNAHAEATEVNATANSIFILLFPLSFSLPLVVVVV